MERSENKEAHRTYVKAIALTKRYNYSDNMRADELLASAYSLDGSFTRALSWRAYVALIRYQEAWSSEPEKDLDAALRMARDAVRKDKRDYSNQWTYAIVCHSAAGAALDAGDTAKSNKLTAAGDDAFQRALSMKPVDDPDLLVMYADILIRRDTPARAVKQIFEAIQLRCPGWYLWSLGSALFHDRQYRAAISVLESMRKPEPRVSLILAASYARLSESMKGAARKAALKAAGEALRTFRDAEPNWSLDHEKRDIFAIWKDAGGRAHWMEAIALADDPAIAAAKSPG